VLCAIARHDHDLAVIADNWKPDSIDGIARADLAEDVGFDVGVTRRRVEVVG